jgi:DNA-binding NtrC family response regulator
MISFTIHVVDDEPTIRDGIAMALSEDYQTAGFATAEEALAAMADSPPDLVLLDIGLPGMNGIEALSRIKTAHPDLPVIMITAYEDVGTVIDAMKTGAYDYVLKPIQMDSLEINIGRALETVRLKKEIRLLQDRYIRENIPPFIGESNAIQHVMDFIEKVARSPDTPVLILGETGTGKELIASAIHYRSPNFRGPLVTVNCAAIPENLIESELFGYERGAFSGANAGGKKGLIEEAAGGTLFLDEVGDLGLPAQAKLLRFLEAGEFYKLGGTRKHTVRTRVVSATNQDIGRLIEDGRFRKDLYFRLEVVKVKVPSLNERRNDIVPLAKHFLVECGEKLDRRFTGISKEAEKALHHFTWTGNIRELKNRIERAVLVGEGQEITLEDLGFESSDPPEPGFPPLTPEGIDLPALQEAEERHCFTEALRLAEGNESAAARLLNLNHHTFRYRRKKLEIP